MCSFVLQSWETRKAISVTRRTIINYDNKLLEIKTIFKVWKRRQLTPLSKITVIKTLAMSKIIYLFINLPDPPDIFLRDLEAALFHFLWDGKQSKISKRVVCKSYQGGGLKIFDVLSFLATMKASWIYRSGCVESNLKDFVLNMYPVFANLRTLGGGGGEYASVLMQTNQNPFWSQGGRFKA